MSISSNLTKLTTDITNAYTSINNKGGTIPANKNTNNLSTAIDSIQSSNIIGATAEGESLNLTNTKAMPYNDYVVEGKSEQDGEPSPSNPSEIHSVADDVNLFDKNSENIADGYISASGYFVQESGNIDETVYIKCKPNTTYTVQKMLQNTTSKNRFVIGTSTVAPTGQINVNILYRANEGSNITSYTVTTDSNANYLLFFCYNTDTNTSFEEMLNSIKISEFPTLTPYSPYNQGTVTIKQRGKNLIDNNNLQYDFSNVPNTYNQLETIETGIRYSTTYPAGTPVIVFNTGIDLTNHIGKTIKMKSTISTNAGSIRVGIANADTSLRQSRAETNISNKEISFLVTDDLGEKKYLVYFLSIDVGIGNTTDFKNLTLTIDEEPIYEPYQTPHDYTIQTELLSSLPNGVKDTIEEEQHRKIGTYIFDGTEYCVKYVNSTYAFAVYLPVGVPDIKHLSSVDRVLCSHLQHTTLNNIYSKSETQGNNLISTQGTRTFAIMINDYTSTTDLQTYLAQQYANGTPVIIQYELAEEIIEPLTQNQATTMLDIIKTGSYEGTTNIYTDEDVKPTIGVGYYKKG